MVWPTGGSGAAIVMSSTSMDPVKATGSHGDWAMHCHMTHHVMNQMGHGIPNMIGMKPRNLDHKVRSLLPAYMTMGQDGMGIWAKWVCLFPRTASPWAGLTAPLITSPWAACSPS